MEVLNRKVSYQPNAWSPLVSEITIYEALREIQSEKYKQQITSLRKLLISEDRSAYNSHKKKLPAVTFAGTFDKERKKSNLKDYSHVIILDIDKLTAGELARVKTCMQNEPWVFAYWESPSQEGVKALVSFNCDFQMEFNNVDLIHKSVFQKLIKHFKLQHNVELDESGSDLTRLCFFSHDATLNIKEEIRCLNLLQNEILPRVEIIEKKNKSVSGNITLKSVLFNSVGKNRPSDRYTIGAIIKYLERKKLSITASYDEWYKVAMAIASTFTYEIGEKYFLKLSSFDTSSYNENNCRNFLRNCYETGNGTIKFSTLVFIANKTGYLTKIQRDRGSEVVDENLSQVSSSNTAFRSPEDLKG